MHRLLFIMIILLLAPFAGAVGASHWVHTTEADFKKGTLHNAVATNLGDIKLSRAVKTILEQDPDVSAVYSMAQTPDGTIYAGTGPHGVLLRIKDDKVTQAYHPEGASNIFSLIVDSKGRLLMGTGGEKGQILRLDPADAAKGKAKGRAKAEPKVEEVFSAEGVQYIWAMTQTPDGNLYAATGPNGQIFEIKPDGSHSVLIDSDENNILSLISDGKDTLYAGTDPNGLIYRINRKTKGLFVLYDAAESEVSTLALDSKGNLYAGTAEASEPAAAPHPDEGAKEKAGRPEGTGGVPIPSQPPEAPAPPKLPDPAPNEPNPIPKAKFMIGQHLRTGYMLLADDNPDDPNNPTPAPPAPGQPNPGKQKPNPAKPGTTPPANPNQPQPPEPIDFGKPRAEGNAIYKIDPEGFVHEIFRQPVMVLSIIERGGVLLVATGSEGLIYQVDPAAEETSVLAKVDPNQVLCMLPTADGRILLGMANVGSIASMSSGYATEGSFVSPVLDATQISRFGKFRMHGSLPRDTTLTVATRSGNVQDPERAGWSSWSEESAAQEYIQVAAPSARFLQYRLSLTSKEGKETAVIDEVDVAYQMPNLAPVVKAVKVGDKLAAALEMPTPNPAAAAGAAAAAAAAANAAKTNPRNPVEPITWDAEDANGDSLVYSLYFRSGSKAPWILLKDKLTENRFDWDTRGVADGRYEIRVVASDAAANPPGQGRTGARVSDPVIVDNTPPAIGEVKTIVKGGQVTLHCRIVDRTSTVASMDYNIDSGGDWQAVLPSDNIFDSPEETVDFTSPSLTPGVHQITLRAADAKGNHAYETVLVTIAAQAGK